MDKIKVYASYGVLAHEKQPFYSQYPASDIYDELYISVPEGWEAWEAENGRIIVKKHGGFTYTLDEVLTNTRTGKPVFQWVENFGETHSAHVEIVE